MTLDPSALASELRKRTIDDERNEDLLSRLSTEYERQRRAVEDERRRSATDTRLLLNQAADMVTRLETVIQQRDEEILLLKERVAKLEDVKEESGFRAAQPGPPLTSTSEGNAGIVPFSDVVQKVSALNEEIFQAGALLAETLVYQVADADMAEHTQRRQAVIADTMGAVGRYLGNTLTDLLAIESMKPQEGPANQLLVQIVLIIALTRWCSSVCRGWIPEDPETSQFLQDLYDGIRKAEDQAVAGRWRSLTRAHLDITAEGWSQDVMRVINCILGLAGWETQTPEDLSQFEKRLSSIFKALRDVRKATGEDVTSADLEVYAIHRGDEFEPTRMEDSYGDDRAGASAQGGKKERVAGPSGLGLRKVTVVKTKEGYEKRAEGLSLPKVVLEKTVREAIEPPPPPKSRKKKDKGEPTGGIRGMLGI